MYFALKTDCYFRRYGDIGYICRPIIGLEDVVDNCGAFFLEQLTYMPKDVNEIAKDLCNSFYGATIDELKKDAIEFFLKLKNDEFINSGENIDEFENIGFDYSTLKGRVKVKNINSDLGQSSAIYLDKYSKEKPFLQTFHIELTSKCNERCIHCYIPHEKKDINIEKDLMLKVLNQCKKMGVMTVIFSGGEPMLHPHFCEFLRYAKDLDFNVTILTNLTLLNDEIIEVLKYKHASCVNVSLYSMNSEVHDSITTIKGSYEKTKNNILKLIDNNIPVQINCPIMKQNRDSFSDVIRWGQANKCAVVTDYVIMARSDRTTDNLENRLTKNDLRGVIEQIAQNNYIFKANIENEKPFEAVPEGRVCGVGLSTLCMVATGLVYPCAGWQQYVCGDINRVSLQEIWNNSPQIEYLRKLRLKDFKKCVRCKDYKYCLMCVSRNYNESRNQSMFDIPQITCDAAKIHHVVVDEYREK